MGRPERSIIVVGALVLLLVALAVVTVVALGSTASDDFPADSPEATVQRYITAISERDSETAYGLLSERAQQMFTPEDFSDALRYNVRDVDNQRIRIGQVERNGDRATVHLMIDRFWGSGVDFNRSTSRTPIPVVRDEGEWKIDDPITWIGLGPTTLNVAVVD